MSEQDKPIINHAEALGLAGIKYNESNIARCYIDLQEKSQQQAAELAALRGYCLEENAIGTLLGSVALKYKLIDETGKPTSLLTGNKDEIWE